MKQEAKLVFYASGPVKKYNRTSLRVHDTKVNTKWRMCGKTQIGSNGYVDEQIKEMP